MNLIILDRDGVINEESPSFIKSPEEWIPIKGSLEAIATLNAKGYQVAVATNQSGVGRGLYTLDTLAQIHAKLKTDLSHYGGQIDFFAICPHHPDDNCVCRKPKSGLFEQIKRHFACDLSGVLCVGDSLRDLQAAQSAGGEPVLVLTGNGEKTRLVMPEHTQVYASLAALVKTL